MTVLLVETSEQDTFEAVATFVGELLNEGQTKTVLAETPGSRFAQDCQLLLAEGQFEEFIKRLLPHVELLYATCSREDVECCVNVLLHALERVDKAKLTGRAHDLAQAIAAKPTERADEKLQALLTLYNLCPSPQAQYTVFLDVLEFAKHNRALAASSLVPLLRGKAEELVRLWKLPDKQAYTFYMNMAALFKLVGDRAGSKELLRLLTSALRLAKADDARGVEELRNAVLQAAGEVLRAPDTFSADFAHLPAVTALAADAAAGPTLKLLTAVLDGNVAGLSAVCSDALCNTLGTSADALRTKTRLLALLRLGGSGASATLSFEEIQNALQVERDDVPLWLVRAIGKKLVEAKIDEVREVVTLSRRVQRSFGPHEWGQLEGQLAAWRDSLAAAAQLLHAQGGIPLPKGLAVKG